MASSDDVTGEEPATVSVVVSETNTTLTEEDSRKEFLSAVSAFAAEACIEIESLLDKDEVNADNNDSSTETPGKAETPDEQDAIFYCDMTSPTDVQESTGLGSDVTAHNDVEVDKTAETIPNSAGRYEIPQTEGTEQSDAGRNSIPQITPGHVQGNGIPHTEVSGESDEDRNEIRQTTHSGLDTTEIPRTADSDVDTKKIPQTADSDVDTKKIPQTAESNVDTKEIHQTSEDITQMNTAPKTSRNSNIDIRSVTDISPLERFNQAFSLLSKSSSRMSPVQLSPKQMSPVQLSSAQLSPKHTSPNQLYPTQLSPNPFVLITPPADLAPSPSPPTSPQLSPAECRSPNRSQTAKELFLFSPPPPLDERIPSMEKLKEFLDFGKIKLDTAGTTPAQDTTFGDITEQKDDIPEIDTIASPLRKAPLPNLTTADKNVSIKNLDNGMIASSKMPNKYQQDREFASNFPANKPLTVSLALETDKVGNCGCPPQNACLVSCSDDSVSEKIPLLDSSRQTSENSPLFEQRAQTSESSALFDKRTKTPRNSALLGSAGQATVPSDPQLTNGFTVARRLREESSGKNAAVGEQRKEGVQTNDGDIRVVDLGKAMEQSLCQGATTPEKSVATFFVGSDSVPASRQNSCQDQTIPLTKNENGTGNGIVGLNGNGNDEEVTLRHGRKSQKSMLLGSLFMILSGLYGILIVVLGAVIPLTEIFVKEDGTAFEAFYIYLYSVSILFLCYVYIYLLRRNRLRTEFLTKTLSRSISFTRGWANSWARGGSDRSRQRKRMVSLDESNHHTGTFYLRLGVLGFGIGSMIHSGLNFGKFFGSITEGQCNNGVSLLMKPLLHLIFTFSQLYFIFMNSKMCIQRKKVLARFGLMHMAATNICVWFRSIVVETLHEIHHHHEKTHHHDHHGDSHVPSHETDYIVDGVDVNGVTASYNSFSEGSDNLTLTLGRKLLAAAMSSSDDDDGGLLELRCSWSNMMGKAVDAAGPYLYPCTIEYSLMCAGILYVMWSNVGTRPRYRTDSEMEDMEENLKHQRMSVDCTSSSRGLFLGIFLTVCAIISIIAFYVMVSQPHLKSEALLLTHLSETLIYCVTTFALVMAALKMRNLVFHSDHKSDLEETLIIIAYTGLLAFNIFSLIAAILMTPAEGAALTIISNFTMMLQSALQTIFLLAGDRMSAANGLQERKKPGREYVTFLLLCNFAMWIINTFETQKPEHNPLQVKFYGPEAWSIFSHISVPLGIYYRFHSTVCFSNIWKNAWKMRKHH